jgi:hypothetical protein
MVDINMGRAQATARGRADGAMGNPEAGRYSACVHIHVAART